MRTLVITWQDATQATWALAGALALVLTGCDRYYDVLVWWLAGVLP
jgi:hypothetical protein